MIAFIILLVVVVGFAWNLGVHYTGAVMGMPRAARAISEGPALVLIAILTILGATFASAGVEKTVGQNIVPADSVGVADATVIVLAAAPCGTPSPTFARLQDGGARAPPHHHAPVHVTTRERRRHEHPRGQHQGDPRRLAGRPAA